MSNASDTFTPTPVGAAVTATVPGTSGPFKDFLLPGFGNSARFDGSPIRNTSRWPEAQFGLYDPNPVRPGSYNGPVLNADASGARLAGFNQALNVIAAMNIDAMHEVACQKWPRFWIDRIKRETFPSFKGWERKITIFRGGLLKQSGMSEWRRINSVPVAGANHPSNLPGFNTYTYTTEELTGVGFEAGWGSDPINIDELRNVPDAAAQIKEILDVGVDYGLSMQEVHNRETYIGITAMANRSFVMCSDCPCDEGLGARTYIYDSRVGLDARKATNDDVAKAAAQGVTITENDYIAEVADRSSIENKTKIEKLDQSTMCDSQGQYHALAENVRDPNTGETAPFAIVNAEGEIEPVNFDMLERLNDSLAQRCPEAAIGNDAGVPMFAITLKHDDIDKLIRATPIEWDAWRRSEPKALIDHYNMTMKTYRRWGIVNDTNQLRLKPVRVIENYTAEAAKAYGSVGYRAGDDPGLQGKRVFVCLVVNPKMNSKYRFGTNGAPVPVNNPEYFKAPLAIANVFVNDAFVNQYEGQPNSVGSGTHFGPAPAMNGQWGWLNIPDRATNPFGTVGNFYGLFRIHIRPTRYTQDTTSFIYARDMQVFKAMTQAQNKIVNPDYDGSVKMAEFRSCDCDAIDGKVTDANTAETKVSAGTAIELDLAQTPHLALTVGQTAKLVGWSKAGNAGTAVETETDVVVLDTSSWPRVAVAPVAELTLADASLVDTVGGTTGAYTHKIGVRADAGDTAYKAYLKAK